MGTAGFVYWETEHARAEFGYSLSRAFWGKGLATEAARAIITFGFEVLALNRIEAKCMVENVASERVMQKAGLRFDAVLRQYWQKHGTFHDVKVYALLSSDWSPASTPRHVGA
ncbi:putative ribosomal N-acetyltransferase YdaF [compost metagenome]